MAIRMACTIGLVVLCFGCGGDSSNSSKKPSAESLVGAWRQSAPDSSSTTPSPSSQQGQNKLPKMLQASGSVSSAGLYLFVSEKRVNLMTEAGVSSPCELDRAWTLNGRVITLEDKAGCDDLQARVKDLTSSQLIFSAEGEEGSQAVFTRTTEDELEQLTNAFSLSSAGLPQALKNYLAEREQPDKKPEAEQSAATNVKALTIHRELAVAPQPQPGLLDGTTGRLIKTNNEPSPSIFLQDGTAKAWDVDLDRTLCTLILPQGKTTVPAGQIKIAQTRHQEMQIEGKGTRVGLVMEVDPSRAEAAHLESVICFGGPEASRFTWQDFRNAVGPYLSVVR